MTSSRQTLRSEETKRTILHAAGLLFSQRGFDAVTMREIAKAAGCSHTTIYLYFKDKESLLHQLSMEPLTELQGHMSAVLNDPTLPPDDKLTLITQRFIEFCLLHRNMYNIFFMEKATRVDVTDPDLDVNKLRLEMFAQLRRAIQDCLPPGQPEENVLAYARIYFYTLSGIVGTYTASEETVDQLLARLAPTFDLAVHVMLSGIKQTVNMGVDLG